MRLGASLDETEFPQPPKILSAQIDHLEALTRESVGAIFRDMLAMEVTDGSPELPFAEPAGQLIGSVGFVGHATGRIHLHAGVGFARVITCRMLGLSEAELDSEEMVDDAMGELSNMVVGHVKSRLCDCGRPCTLTIPSVVRGHQLSVENVASFTRRTLGFRSGDQCLKVEMLLQQSPA